MDAKEQTDLTALAVDSVLHTQHPQLHPVSEVFVVRLLSSCSMSLPDQAVPNDEQRRAALESLLQCDAVFADDTSRMAPCATVVLMQKLRVNFRADALAFTRWLPTLNAAVGCNSFTGVVMKRASSPHPLQIRSAIEGFRCRWKQILLA